MGSAKRSSYLNFKVDDRIPSHKFQTWSSFQTLPTYPLHLQPQSETAVVGMLVMQISFYESSRISDTLVCTSQS